MRGLIVGLGSIGRRHLRNLRQLMPDADITVLRHQHSAGESESQNLADRVVYELDEALDMAPEIAIIASPAPFHIQTALQLARANTHLLLEKPISDRLDGVDELIRICRRGNLALLIGYTLRFYSPLRAAREAIRSGRIGRVIGFQSEVGQYLPDWRTGVPYQDVVTARRNMGGGVLLELSHELDCARWLVGEVRAISATAQRVSDLEIDVEDWAELSVHFADGVIGHIHLDMVQRVPTRRCRVIGTDGTLSWEAASNRVACYSSAKRDWEEVSPAAEVDRNEMYVRELQHFLACVRGEASPEVTGEDGKRALQIALAARRSSETQRTVEL